MGLYNLSIINFGVEVTTLNRSIDFKISGGGSELNATLRVGLYSVKTLALEVKRAMTAADPSNTYTITVNRTAYGNTITIATSGVFLSILFASGTRSISSSKTLLGFANLDKTGATSYTGTGNCGTILIPSYPPQDYQPIGSEHDIKSSQNEATSGVVETVSFAYFRNFEMRFKWIQEGTAEFTQFQQLHIWLLRGGAIEFTESQAAPTAFTVGIPIKLKSPITLKRMTPSLYDYFESPHYTFREVP